MTCKSASTAGLMFLLSLYAGIQGGNARTLLLKPECGGPMSLCGLSLPSNSTCRSNPGYCQPGYYCSKCFSSDCKDASSRCRSLPPDCGKKVGSMCCPSNAYSPLDERVWKEDIDETPGREILGRPRCSNNLTCRYDFKVYQGTNGQAFHPEDRYAIALLNDYGECISVEPECGVMGKPCCPAAYPNAFSYNPRPRGYKCQVPWKSKYDSYCNYTTDVCTKNPADCGQQGKPCCIVQYTKAETPPQFSCMTNAANLSTASGGTSATSDTAATSAYIARTDAGIRLVAPGYTCSTQGKGARWTSGAQVTCLRCPDDWKKKFSNDSVEYKECAAP